jgi:hypothetical protein
VTLRRTSAVLLVAHAHDVNTKPQVFKWLSYIFRWLELESMNTLESPRINVGRLDRVRRMQKNSKNEKRFLFEKSAACNSLERLMPRDGIEPPPPAFSDRTGTVPSNFPSLRNLSNKDYFERITSRDLNNCLQDRTKRFLSWLYGKVAKIYKVRKHRAFVQSIFVRNCLFAAISFSRKSSACVQYRLMIFGRGVEQCQVTPQFR